MREETDPTGDESGITEKPEQNEKSEEDGDDALVERHRAEVCVLLIQQFLDQHRVLHLFLVFTRSVDGN